MINITYTTFILNYFILITPAFLEKKVIAERPAALPRGPELVALLYFAVVIFKE